MRQLYSFREEDFIAAEDLLLARLMLPTYRWIKMICGNYSAFCQ
jgi:hypothetical protein